MSTKKECEDTESPIYGICEKPVPSSDYEAVVDDSAVKPPEPVVEYEIRNTFEVVGWVTPLPTQAELALATTTAAYTATVAVVATSIVQQLIRVLTPVLKFGFMKVKKKLFPPKDIT